MKIKLIADCVVNYSDDTGGKHETIGTTVDVQKDTANSLVRMGRAKFLKKADDFNEAGVNVITEDDEKVIAHVLEARAASVAVTSAKATKAA